MDDAAGTPPPHEAYEPGVYNDYHLDIIQDSSDGAGNEVTFLYPLSGLPKIGSKSAVPIANALALIHGRRTHPVVALFDLPLSGKPQRGVKNSI
jgi:hypothetical protein